MRERPRFIELNYYQHDEFSNAADVIKKHRPSNLFAPFLTDRMKTCLVKHANFSGTHRENGIDYRFFKSKNGFLHIPFTTHRFIKEQEPDLLLVQGLIFPLQVITLARQLKNCKIVLQHQGETPFGKKKIFQQWADRFVDGYIFTSLGNASEWIDKKVIKDQKKCFEIIPSSTEFTRQEKDTSKQRTGMTGPVNFLWVGRLNENKDPITVLKGFEQYFIDHPSHKLYMIYGEEDLLPTIKKMMKESPILGDRVELIGKVVHPQLECWYSAADYFVSGSHREGGSYALTEAMACGCIPVVTAIPPAQRVIGSTGYSYSVGDSKSLYEVLSGLDHERRNELSANVLHHFRQHHSARSIADKIYELYRSLIAE